MNYSLPNAKIHHDHEESLPEQLLRSVYNGVTSLRETKLGVYVAYVVGGVTTSLIIRKVFDVFYRKWKNYPPGPCGLPLFGSFFSLAFNGNFSINTNKEYGSIVMCYNGLNQPTIILSNYDIIFQYYKLDSFSQRIECGMFKNDNLTWINNNKNLKIRRGILIESLISQIQSKSFINIIINTVNNQTCNNINNCIKYNNSIWNNVRNDINYLVFANVYATVFGQPFDVSNETKYNEYLELRKNITNFFANANKTFTINHFLFGNLPSMLVFVKQYILNKSNFHFYQNEIKLILKKWINDICGRIDNCDNNNSNSNTFLYKLLKLEKEGIITRDELIGDLSVSFNAGLHSTAMALEQSILFLAKYPKMQEEIYDELKLKLKQFELNQVNTVNNKEFLQTIRSCARLNAFIHETLRCHGFMTTLLTRELKKQVKIEVSKEKTYTLPKGSHVIANIRSVNDAIIDNNNNNNEQQLWNFNYKNWLKIIKNDEKNNVSVKFNKQFNRNFLTFGSGLRSCLGEPLAKTQLYLVISVLILKYKFIVPNNITNDRFNIPIFYTPFTKTIDVMCQNRDQL